MKAVFLFSLISFSLYAQEQEPAEQMRSIAWQEISRGSNYWEINLEFKNGDRISYTYMPKLQADACIYAQKQEGNFEKRFTANGEWQKFMRNVFQNSLKQLTDREIKSNYFNFLQGLK